MFSIVPRYVLVEMKEFVKIHFFLKTFLHVVIRKFRFYVWLVIFLLDSTDLEPVRFHINSLMAETRVHHGIVTRFHGESEKLELDGKRRRKSWKYVTQFEAGS